MNRCNYESTNTKHLFVPLQIAYFVLFIKLTDLFYLSIYIAAYKQQILNEISSANQQVYQDMHKSMNLKMDGWDADSKLDDSTKSVGIWGRNQSLTGSKQSPRSPHIYMSQRSRSPSPESSYIRQLNLDVRPYLSFLLSFFQFLCHDHNNDCRFINTTTFPSFLPEHNLLLYLLY